MVAAPEFFATALKEITVARQQKTIIRQKCKALILSPTRLRLKKSSQITVSQSQPAPTGKPGGSACCALLPAAGRLSPDSKFFGTEMDSFQNG